MKSSLPLQASFLVPAQFTGSSALSFVDDFLEATCRTEVGWHYRFDLAWIYSQALSWPKGIRVLDAGGGYGPVQFLLYEMGFNVTNIDMVLRSPKREFREAYDLSFRELDSLKTNAYWQHLMELEKDAASRGRWLGRMRGLVRDGLRVGPFLRRQDQWRSRHSGPRGKLQWVAGNLVSMPEIADDFFDAVVSMSALEHIPLHELHGAVEEIRRVCRTDARWAVTTSGTDRKETWFHKPSKGNCFSGDDVEKLFGATGLTLHDGEEVMREYRQCKYLKSHLAQFYAKGSENGMPWGKWDPQYLPIGLSMVYNG